MQFLTLEPLPQGSGLFLESTMIAFKVIVQQKLVAAYSEIQWVLESVKYHLEDCKQVSIIPEEMTESDFVDLTDALLRGDQC